MRIGLIGSGSSARTDVAPRRCGLSHVRVCQKPGRKAEAMLLAGPLAIPCVIGPAGLRQRKREGDAATPRGTYSLVGCFYRTDRGPRPRCRLPLRATRPDDGWCDDPGAASYNQPVRLPFGWSHEAMWRHDRLYDLGVVVDYNQSRPRKHLGSAIFIHVMAPDGTPTAGCIALRPDDLRRLLPRLAPGCSIRIG